MDVLTVILARFFQIADGALDSFWSSVVGSLSLEFARVQRTYVPFFVLVDFFPRLATHGLRNGKNLSHVSCENEFRPR